MFREKTSKIKRGRKPNRPKQAKQIPQSDTDLTLEVIRDKQESDSILKQILKYKIEGRKPDLGEISYESVHLKYWLARWESIDLKNGILCMYWDDDTKKGRWKICAPNSIEKTILWYLHDTKTAGHLGIKKTYEKAKLSPFYWRNMQESIKNYVNQCEICGERKNPPNKKRHCMKSYVVGDPFERIATDIAGPFPITDNKNRYILVVGDYFSKLTKAYAMQDIQAKTVANIIFRASIKRYGCPIEVHSDQGKQYESALFKEMCTLLEINKTRTTPFHPRSDGMIECMNRG
ncbi:Hypothetical predicted protein [Mytilus galloprovincialis]|uniref:Integrase catalytic domain-containing protein n=1 Tax=Mytilus galloprovincialis TaxID=29158 RepID=A0A8B6E061_MYTGA|nr:Hypothetical predicted protein [Mytilus galloprovincialis]